MRLDEIGNGASMAQAPAVGNFVQLTFKDDDNEATVKRMKKEPGVITGKSVVVLKNSDVTTRNDIVFMPNTIEMAQLKKPDRGQFKTNVQISSKMTEADIKKILMETFPFLECRRFCCAAAVDNRTRLDFHGEPRIWDGHFIKRKIKGNSALYIFTDEENVEHQDAKVSEQSTLKRSHDQITNQANEKSEQAMKKETVPEDNAKLPAGKTVYPGTEKQAKMFAAPGFSPKNIASYPSVASGASGASTVPTVLEKSDHFHPTEVQLLRQKILDKMSPVQGVVYVPVTAQHGDLCAVNHQNISAIHDTRNAKDGATAAASSLTQSIPMGTIMVPGGIIQPGMIPRSIISTASDQQSSGKAVFHIADGRDTNARQTGLPLIAHSVPHVIVSSTLTPQMDSLNISNAASLQKPSVYVEKSAGKRDQSAQTTEGRDSCEHVLPMTAAAQSDRHFHDESFKKEATGLQHGVGFGSVDQSKHSLHKNVGSQVVKKRAYVNAADREHQHELEGRSASEHEVIRSQVQPDLTDSGFETSDNLGEISQSNETYLHTATETQRLQKKVDKLGEAEWTGSEIEEEGGLSLLSGVALNALKIRSAVTETTSLKSIVGEICPNTSPVKGGGRFFLIFSEHLPSDVVSGQAYFGNIAPVTLIKVNEFNMAGHIPAAHGPGVVTVTVRAASGHYLGKTSFEYTDDVQTVLQQLVHDSKLQTMFFQLWAQGLGNTASECVKKQTSKFSTFRTSDTERPGSTNNFFQLLARVWHETRKETGIAEIESDYDADDEASSSESSEDGDICCNTSGCPNSKGVSCRTFNMDSDKSEDIETHDLHCGLDDTNRLSPSQFYQPLRTLTRHMTKQFTSEDLTSKKFCQTGDNCDEVKYLTEMMLLLLSKPEDVPIHDNLENLPSTFHGQEMVADIGQPNSPALPLSHKETTDDARDSCDTAGDNRDVPGRSNKLGDMEIVDGQLSSIDFDENSASDKSRRTQFAKRSDKMDDSPAADL